MAFSTIDADTSWQDLAIAQQIAVAYNKRRTACGLSTLTAPDSATTVFDFVLAVQTGLEELAALQAWADHTAALAAQTSLPSAFSTASAFMTFAGLTQSGYWRRIAEGGTQPATWTNYTAAGWSYGKITSKDLAGPWLWQDLMTALSAMKRLVYDTVEPVPNLATTSTGETRDTAAPSTPAWELSGNVSTTAVSNTVLSRDVHITVTKSYNISDGGYKDKISGVDIRLLRFKGPYRGVSGTSVTTTFVGLISSSSTATFESVTGWASSLIGKTVTRTTGDRSTANATAWCWLWLNPGPDTDAWSEISSAIPWSSVPDGGSVTKQLILNDSDCRVVNDYAFVDGATS